MNDLLCNNNVDTANNQSTIEDNRKDNNNNNNNKQLNSVVILEENDVLIGRGAPSVRHAGNIQFRKWVDENMNDYIAAGYQHAVKAEIARTVIAKVLQNNGRFLCRDNDSGDLIIVQDNNFILEKAKQAFRDLAKKVHLRLSNKKTRTTKKKKICHNDDSVQDMDITADDNSGEIEQEKHFNNYNHINNSGQDNNMLSNKNDKSFWLFLQSDPELTAFNSTATAAPGNTSNTTVTTNSSTAESKHENKVLGAVTQLNIERLVSETLKRYNASSRQVINQEEEEACQSERLSHENKSLQILANDQHETTTMTKQHPSLSLPIDKKQRIMVRNNSSFTKKNIQVQYLNNEQTRVVATTTTTFTQNATTNTGNEERTTIESNHVTNTKGNGNNNKQQQHQPQMIYGYHNYSEFLLHLQIRKTQNK